MVPSQTVRSPLCGKALTPGVGDVIKVMSSPCSLRVLSVKQCSFLVPGLGESDEPLDDIAIVLGLGGAGGCVRRCGDSGHVDCVGGRNASKRRRRKWSGWDAKVEMREERLYNVIIDRSDYSTMHKGIPCKQQGVAGVLIDTLHTRVHLVSRLHASLNFTLSSSQLLFEYDEFLVRLCQRANIVAVKVGCRFVDSCCPSVRRYLTELGSNRHLCHGTSSSKRVVSHDGLVECTAVATEVLNSGFSCLDLDLVSCHLPAVALTFHLSRLQQHDHDGILGCLRSDASSPRRFEGCSRRP
ncbi:hypothetical protein KCU81_g727, partial [Aureobasidium melanogenum]